MGFKKKEAFLNEFNLIFTKDPILLKKHMEKVIGFLLGKLFDIKLISKSDGLKLKVKKK